jgi:hypothetical protein
MTQERKIHGARRPLAGWLSLAAIAGAALVWGSMPPRVSGRVAAQPTAAATEPATPADTPVPADSPTPADTPLPSATPSPLPTATDTRVPTITPTPSRTPLPTVTLTPTPTPCGPQPTPDTSLYVEAQVDGNIVRGMALPGGQVTIELKDAGGAVKADMQVTAGADGTWVATFQEDPKAPIPKPLAIRPGWQVSVNAPNGSATLRIAALKVLVDPDNRTISGTAPPGAVLRLRASFHTQEISITADGQGRYSTPWLGQGDLDEAGAWAEILFPTAAGRWVFARDRIASVVIQLGSPVIRITAPPLAHISASVEHEVNGIRRVLGTVTGEISGLGEVEVSLKDQSDGHAIAIAPGQTVIATSSSFQYTHRLRVPNLAAFLTPGGNFITGYGPAGKVVKARFEWKDLPGKWCEVKQYVRQGLCDAGGVFTIPLHRTLYYPADIPRPVADLARVTLYYQTAENDEVRVPVNLSAGPIVSRAWTPILGYYWQRQAR